MLETGYCSLPCPNTVKTGHLKPYPNAVITFLSTCNLVLCVVATVSATELVYSQDMQRQGLQANTSTFNILLLGFSRSNSPDKVLATYSQMKQFGVTPNAFTFKVTIRSLVWNARPLEGLSVYTQMTEFGYVPDNFTYNGLIEGLCQAGHVDEAFVIFQDMEDRGLSPDSIAHAALIKGLDVKGRVQEALRMFQEMTGKNLRSVVETRNGVMGVFSKRHKGDGLSSDAA